MKKVMYRVTWKGMTARVSSTYYMGAVQKAAALWGVGWREILQECEVTEMYEFESVRR